MPYRIIRTTSYPHAPESALPEERRILGAAGAEVVPVECETAAELAEAARGADALLVSGVPVTRGVLAAMPACRGVVTASVGFDAIDLAAATARGIPVANVPDFCQREVANHTIGLLLACARKIVLLHDAVHAGRWDRAMFPPMAPIHGETLGLIAFGRIAREVARRARAFYLRVVAHDPLVDAATAAEHSVELLPLDDLLRQSDYVSVHAPLTPETRHLLSDREFALMKPTATVLNTARGPVIDEAALIRALREGRIRAAGIDVFEQEPVAPDNPLLGLPNVVTTPHSGGYSEEAIRTGRRLAAEDLARILRGERPRSLVNRDLDATRAWATAG